MNQLTTYLKEINYLCQQHKVKKLYVFGAALTNSFNETSDIDLIVDFNNIEVEDYADNYFDFKFSLQDILNRPIDLLEEKALENPYFKKTVLKDRELIYG
ncbi:MAG: nucleotidyltransferase family protein [Ferruginibacter sp.]